VRAEIERPQLSESDRTRLRLLEQQRLATWRARESAERALAEAEGRLDRIPLLVRGRRRADLRSQIAREQSAIRLADEKLASLEPDIAQAKGGGGIEFRPPRAEPRRAPQRDLAFRRSEDIGRGL
jgi:hypothetical protein